MGDLIQVGLLGLGTVGGGVVRLLETNAEQIRNRAGASVAIRRIAVRDLSRPRRVAVDRSLLTTDPRQVIDDPEIQIVVELIGGLSPAREYILAALSRGKSVVTANKEVIAKCGPELFEAAARHGADLYFEASVAGGIPIIKPLREALVGNRIRSLTGIINGTTNYMLTKMAQEGRPFAEVLEEAKQHGYAEADPTSDIEGYDAAYKLSILASIAYETHIPPDAIYCEGITRITPADMAFARELGFVVKLIALARESDGQIEVRVHPAFIPQRHPLAAVHDVFNAIFVQGDAVGDLMFYGRGAGELPTASAVVGDIVDVARNLLTGVNGRVLMRRQARPICPIEEVTSRYYVRLAVVDRSGVLAGIAAAFGSEDVSIESVIQKGRGEDPVDLVFVTHDVKERNIRRALAKIATLPVVRDVANVIRVGGE